jgi:hypothetical protein
VVEAHEPAVAPDHARAVVEAHEQAETVVVARAVTFAGALAAVAEALATFPPTTAHHTRIARRWRDRVPDDRNQDTGEP